jgi:hypothetical protein
MKWTLAIVGATVICGLAAVGLYERETGVTFANLAEAKARLDETGFYCTPDSADGRLATGFLLSREPVTWSQVGSLRKIGPMGREWQGKAWVTFSAPVWQLQTLPEKAGLRVWGHVLAFGDDQLLRDVDGCLP